MSSLLLLGEKLFSLTGKKNEGEELPQNKKSWNEESALTLKCKKGLVGLEPAMR